MHQQILIGSFSAISKSIFAIRISIKYSFLSIFDIYNIYTLLHRSKLKILANFVNILSDCSMDFKMFAMFL